MKEEKIVSDKVPAVQPQKVKVDRQRDLETKKVKEVEQHRGVVIRYDVDEKGNR